MGKYAAVIPAAGLSSRMKAFKPLLPLGGKAMIDHVLDTLEAAGVERIVLVAGHQALKLQEHLQGRDVQIVINAGYARTQMLDSVKLGLSALEDGFEGVYVTPGDVPLFSVETVRALAACRAEAVRPVWEGRGGHPVFMSPAAARFVQHYAASGGLKGALACLQMMDLPLPDAGALMDADTPEDLERIRRMTADTTKGMENRSNAEMDG